jgi:GTP-binding protein
MGKPVVAIVGRPNVGKSTLFNRIVGARKAVVGVEEGITRDRNYAQASWQGRSFLVVDTGGFYPEAQEEIFAQVKEQALFAVKEADLVVHLLDAKAGLSPADVEIAALLRASARRCLWVVNKVDSPKQEPLMYEFYALGEEVLPVSAATGYGFEELMDRLLRSLPPQEAEGAPEPELPKVAVVGRPNVGKSTFINTLLGKRRLVVSPVAGTTRDAIDTVCTYYGKRYLFIDTAGLKRKSRAYPLERFAMLRALKGIERADVVLLLLDASEGVVAEDQKIAGLVLEHGKALVLVLNKWDLLQEPQEARRRLQGEIQRKLWFFAHAPVLTASGLEGTRTTKVFPLIEQVLAQWRRRVPEGELQEFFQKELLPSAPLPLVRGRRLQLRGLRQVGVCPPSFVLLVPQPLQVKEALLRYVERRLRERFGFGGSPILLRARR